MGRRKEYVREEALAKAMNAFWHKGYHGTSLADLTQATGLNKKTLYAEFGNKESLFHDALALYTGMGFQQSQAVLDQEPYGMENIQRYFRGMSYEPNCRGCLMTMTINEKHLVTQTSMEIIRETLEAIERLLLKNLHAMWEQGKLSSEADCKRLATFLLFSIQGITTMGKYEGDSRKLEMVVETILSVLDAECQKV